MLQGVPLSSISRAGAVAQLKALSGAGKAESLVIAPPGIDEPKAQMVAPLKAGGATTLVVTPPGVGRTEAKIQVVE